MRDLRDLAVAFVPCYADHAGGGRFLPRQEADSVPEREQALRQLLAVEAGRLAQVPGRCDVILEDRSAYDRNQGKFPSGSIYTDPELNAAIRAYFRRLTDRKTLHMACHAKPAGPSALRDSAHTPANKTTERQGSHMGQVPLSRRVIFSDWHGVLSRDPFWTSIRHSATHPLHAQLKAGTAGVFDPGRNTANEWMKGLLSSDQVIACG